MRKTAAILIIFGSGLVAFGLTGFNGELSAQLSPQARFNGNDGPYQYNGDFQWSMNDRLETTFGILSLVSGVLLRKISN